MKLLYALLMVLAAGVCSAQQPAYTIGNQAEVKTADGYILPIIPAPLKCGKYEEFEPAHSVGTSNLMAMTIPDRCVPILHTVTEKEWQELMERLKWMTEGILCAKDPKCGIGEGAERLMRGSPAHARSKATSAPSR